ncbi:ABC transporter permease [Methylocapsa polymorpha]|uniref:ABC transporter permease n=1 Tax=Methylocapsa polymorpha TaxID=3080828 RepID=A0ABZ0HYM0_9HYPH|nr:ABC transporter permease [Methylocapsa sp. RX1]
MSIFTDVWRRAQAMRADRRAADETDIRPDMALVPAASIAGRALVTVVAIMTFLASLTAGAAILIADASRGWQDQVAHEMTIQIRPTIGRDIEADAAKAAELARKMRGVAAVRPYTKDQSEALLQPWLGTSLDLSELPVPRLIVIALDPEVRLDAAILQRRLAETIPGASVDDHRLWLERLAIMAKTVVLVAAVIFALVLIAMILAVAFATRGAMAGNREIIEILHFVGAADDYISRQFQRHFFRLGLRGGAIGGGSAILAFFTASTLSAWWRATPSGDQVDVMFGDFALGPNVYGAIVLIAAGIAIVTGFVSRVIVFRHLRDLS